MLVFEGMQSDLGHSIIYVLLYLFFTISYAINKSPFKIKGGLYHSLVFFLIYAFVVNNITLMLGLGSYGRVAHFLTVVPIMTLLFFSGFTKKDNSYINYSMLIICVFVVIMGYIFYTNRQNVVDFLNNENVGLNASYFLMYSLPLVMCVKKNYIRYIMMLFIILAVMMSFKRTGFAATLLAIAVYYFVDRFLLGKISFKTILGLILVIGIIVLVVLYISNLTEGYLLVRFTQALDNGDPRDELREIAFKMIVNSDFFPLLFGHGYDMMMYDSPEELASHNDYLEVTYDYGLIGLVLYLNIYLQLFILGRKLLKTKSKFAAPLFASLVLLSICSFFSHIFLYHHFSSLLLLFWAIVIGDYQHGLSDKPLEVHRLSLQQDKNTLN